jgi:hypothetical protein
VNMTYRMPALQANVLSAGQQQDGSVANVQTQTLSLLTALCYPTKLKGFGAQTGTV